MPATDASRGFDRSMRRWARRRGGRPGHAQDLREGRERGRLPAVRSSDADLGPRSSSSPAGRSPSATRARRASAGRRSRRPRSQWPAAGPDALGAAYDRSSDLGTAVGELLAAAGISPTDRPATLALAEVAAAFESVAAARGTRGEGSRSCAGSSSAAIRSPGAIVAEILSAASCASACARGTSRPASRARSGASSPTVQWAGMLTGDIGATAELARDDALDSAELALFHPLKSMLASPVADEAEALARLPPPVWVEDKYDGIRAQLHKQGAEVAALQPRPQRRDRPVPRGRRRGCRRCRGTASSTASCWPGGTARRCPSSSSRRGSGARRRARRSIAAGPGHLRRLRRARAAATAAATGRAAAAAAAARAPRPPRGARPRRAPRASAWRRSSTRPTTRRARTGLRRRPGARQRGADGQGPRLDLRARAPRLRLAQAQEGAHDARLRRRRRRGRARPAPRRAVGLHVRGASTIGPTPPGAAGHDRQGLQRADRRRDRRDDALVRGAHARRATGATASSSPPSSSRSRSTSSIARTATPRASRCASRASSASATTRPPPTSTG